MCQVQIFHYHLNLIAFSVNWKLCGAASAQQLHWVEVIFKLSLLKVILSEFFTDGDDDDYARFLNVQNNWFAPN